MTDSTDSAKSQAHALDGWVERQSARVVARTETTTDREHKSYGRLVIEPRDGWRVLMVVDDDLPENRWFSVLPVVGWRRVKSRTVTQRWACYDDGQVPQRMRLSEEYGPWQRGGAFYPTLLADTWGTNQVLDEFAKGPGFRWGPENAAYRLLAPGDALPDLPGFAEVHHSQWEGPDGIDLVLEKRAGADQ